MPGLLETNIQSLPFLHRGKVRDIYAVGDDKLRLRFPVAQKARTFMRTACLCKFIRQPFYR